MALFCFLLFSEAATRQVVPITITPADFQQFYGDLSSFTKNAMLFTHPTRGYGFMLTQNVVVGDEVLRVPSSLILSPNEIFEWSPQLKDFNSQERLVARVLYEKFVRRPFSLRTFFVHALPVEAPRCPLFWSDLDFQLLNKIGLHPHVKSSFMRSFLILKDKMRKALGNVPALPKEVLGNDAIKWASFHVASRVFDVTEEDLQSWTHTTTSRPSHEKVTKVLVPIIDMANHLPRPYAHQVEGKAFAVQYPTQLGDDFIIKADRNQTAGEEFVWSYGAKHNLHLVDAYGFVLEHNIDDYYFLSFRDAERCFEEAIGPWCHYKVGRMHLSSNCFKHIYKSYFPDSVHQFDLGNIKAIFADSFYSTQEEVLKTLRRYRAVVLEQFEGRMGLREVRRMRSEFTTPEEHLIYTLALETRKTAHAQLMMLDNLYASLVAVL